MRLHDLLHDSQAQPRSLLLGRDVWLKNLLATIRRNSRTVITNFQDRLCRRLPPRHNPNLPTRVDCLNGVQQQIEQRLTKQLFIRFDVEWLAFDLDLDLLFFDVIVQGMHDFVDGRNECQNGGPNLTRT